MTDNISNPISITIPVIFRLNKHYKNSLTPDFTQLRNYYPFSEKYFNKLKLVFDVSDNVGKNIISGLKRKLEELIASGEYTTLAELAKATGYTNSYISRVLKHKK